MQTLQTISCEEIMSTPIAPIPFSVENLLGQHCTARDVTSKAVN